MYVSGQRSRHTGAALLQLLGWIGFLGIGYMARGRIFTGLAMLVGWWLTFWFLLFASVITLGVAHVLMVAVWLVVPPLTALLVSSD